MKKIPNDYFWKMIDSYESVPVSQRNVREACDMIVDAHIKFNITDLDEAVADYELLTSKEASKFVKNYITKSFIKKRGYLNEQDYYYKIFDKYISKENMEFEWIEDDYYDCWVEFDLKMLKDLNIEINNSEGNILVQNNCCDYYSTLNHSSEFPFTFVNLNNEGKTWFWCIVCKPFKRKRQNVGTFYIADSESGGNLLYAYPKIDKYLTKYLKPILNELVRNLDLS